MSIVGESGVRNMWFHTVYTRCGNFDSDYAMLGWAVSVLY